MDLEELEISGNYHITDISPISSLVKLRKLKLFNEGYNESIEVFSSLVNLENLVLYYNDRYYKELVPLHRLEVLKISNAVMEELDISYIAQIYSLKELAITSGGYPQGLINVDRLKNLINLEKLFISSNNKLDISWIKDLQNLRELEVERCTIDDISPLVELPNLIHVGLGKSEVKDITPLLESRSIKTISGPKEGLFYLFWERGIQYTGPYSDR
jgi:Leucine-rich repeat (LRR) protein